MPSLFPNVQGIDRRGFNEFLTFMLLSFLLGTFNLIRLFKGQFSYSNPEAVAFFTVVGTALARLSKGTQQREGASEAINLAVMMIQKSLLAHEKEIEERLAKAVGVPMANMMVPMMIQAMQPQPVAPVVQQAQAGTVTTTTTTTAEALPVEHETPKVIHDEK